MPSSTSEAATSDSTTVEAALSTSIKHSSNPDEPSYANIGRGGAGNYVPSTSLSDSSANPSILPSLDTSVSQTTTSSTGQTPKSRTMGRGGIGNIEASSQGEQMQKALESKEQIAKEENIRRTIEHDVELGLQKPEGVWIEVPEGRETKKES